MARLTWQNVDAPAGGAQAASAMISAGDAFRRAMVGLGGVAGDVQNEKLKGLNNAELLQLAQVGDAASVDQYLSGIANRINPADMNNALVDQILGLRQNAQGFDGTRISQTGSVIQNASAAQSLSQQQAVAEQAPGYNAAMAEAYRLGRLGQTAEAEAIIKQANEQFPAMAGRTDPFAVSSNLTATREQGQGDGVDNRWLRDNREAVFDASFTKTNVADVRAAAYQYARDNGASEAAAQAAATMAGEMWSSGQANIGTTPPTSVDQILAPSGPSGTSPTGAPVVDRTQPVSGFTDPATIKSAIDNDRFGSVIDDIDVTTRHVDSQLAAYETGPIARAFNYLDNQNTEGADMTSMVGKLFDGETDEARTAGVGAFNLAVKQIQDRARQEGGGTVSEAAAKAALLATVNGNPGMIRSFVSRNPNVDIDAATQLAKELVTQSSTMDRGANKVKLEKYQSQKDALLTRMRELASEIQVYQTNPNAIRRGGEAAREEAISSRKREFESLANQLNGLAKNVNDVFGNRPKPPKNDEAPQVSPANAPKQDILGRVEAILQGQHGLTSAELVREAPAINEAVDDARDEANKNKGLVRRVDTILDRADKKLTETSTKATIDSLSDPERIAAQVEAMSGNDQFQFIIQYKQMFPDDQTDYRRMSLVDPDGFKERLKELVRRYEQEKTQKTSVNDAEIIDSILGRR